MSDILCDYCGKPVESFGRSDLAREVKGWEVERTGGGLNQLRHKELTGKVAHKSCVLYSMPKTETIF